MRRHTLHAGVLDAQLLAEQGDLLLQADGGGDAVGGREQGDPGQGEGVEYARRVRACYEDVTRPL